LSYFPFCFRRVKSTFRPEVGFDGAGHRSGPVVAAAAAATAEKTACPVVHAKMSFRKSIAARTGPSHPRLVERARPTTSCGRILIFVKDNIVMHSENNAASAVVYYVLSITMVI
jgi:hypothetical protein